MQFTTDTWEKNQAVLCNLNGQRFQQMKFADEIWRVRDETVKDNLMQDSTDQRVGTFPSQRNCRRKGSGSPDENTNTRRIKLQTSFPPIHLSLISSTKTLDKKHKDYVSNSDVSRDLWGEKFNLPQVEKTPEKIFSKPVKSFADKSKFSKDYGCNLNAVTYVCDGQKEPRLGEKQNWLDMPSTRSMTDRLTPEVTKVSECLTCRNERKVRSEYDKILLQTKREKEALLQKVNVLEVELKKYEEINRITQREDDVSIPYQYEGGSHTGLFEIKNTFPNVVRWSDYRDIEEKTEDKKDCLLLQVEELKAQLDKMQDAEREQEELFKTKQSKLAFDVEDLKLQLHSEKESEKLRISNLQSEKENILGQLENANTELEKLKKRKSLLIAELRKEKDGCLTEIEKLNTYLEKVKAENVALSDTIKLLQQDLEKRSACSCFAPQVFSGGAEVLFISHRTFTENSHAVTDYKYHELSSCGRNFQNVTSTSNNSATTQVDRDEIRIRELYKQLKRERNLLLDVMLVMYARRWFVDDAVPHVRRALRKCGALPEESN